MFNMLGTITHTSWETSGLQPIYYKCRRKASCHLLATDTWQWLLIRLAAMVGHVLKCQWRLHGSLMCTIWYYTFVSRTYRRQNTVLGITALLFLILPFTLVYTTTASFQILSYSPDFSSHHKPHNLSSRNTVRQKYNHRLIQQFSNKMQLIQFITLL